jgi:starvation-inducible DNA-binding protein
MQIHGFDDSKGGNMIRITELEKQAQWNALMNQRLAEAVDLLTQMKQACWNVKRTQTASLHELFDEIAKEVECYSDMVAERIVQLGGIARGTVRAAAIYSRLDEYPPVVGGGNHVEAVARALTDFRRDAYASIGEISALGDGDTANLFAEICCGIDKWLELVQARSKMARYQLRNHQLTPMSASRNSLVNRDLIKPLKRNPVSGF